MARPVQDVRVFSVQDRRSTVQAKLPWIVRRSIDGRQRSNSFRTKAEAERYRILLLQAVHDGERFDMTTGEPESWETTLPDVRMHDWARRWVAEQWQEWQPRTRATAAEALALAARAHHPAGRRTSGQPPAVPPTHARPGHRTRPRPARRGMAGQAQHLAGRDRPRACRGHRSPTRAEARRILAGGDHRRAASGSSLAPASRRQSRSGRSPMTHGPRARNSGHVARWRDGAVASTFGTFRARRPWPEPSTPSPPISLEAGPTGS